MTTPAPAPAPRAAAAANAPPDAARGSSPRPRARRGDGGGTWDDPNLVERLRTLWAQTDPVLSAGEIGRRLGGLRKNQVIGKVHRLGLPARESPLRGGPWAHRPPTAADSPFVRKRRRAARAADPAEPDAPPRERPAPIALTTFAPAPAGAGGAGAGSEPPPSSAGAPPPPAAPPQPAVAAAAASCRWPFGDPKRAGFRFCGAPDVAPGRPYCAAHCAEAYVPAERRAAHLRDVGRAASAAWRGGGR